MLSNAWFFFACVAPIAQSTQSVRVGSSGELTYLADEVSHLAQHISAVAELVASADGETEREEEEPVSLLQTGLQHTRSLPIAEAGAFDVVEDTSLLQRRRPHEINVHESENEFEDVALLQTEAASVHPAPRGGPVVRPAGWDARKHAGALPKAFQAVHRALSMSPSTVFAASTAKLSKHSGHEANLYKGSEQDGSPVVDWLTTNHWSTASIVQIVVGIVALLVVVSQSFSAGDLFDAPAKLKKKKLEDQVDVPVGDQWLSPWLSEKPASLFMLPAGRLFGLASQGGLAEIRGPPDCPVLHAAVAVEGDRSTLSVGSMLTAAEPLATVGPMLNVGVSAVAVHRTSTGSAGSLEPLEAGRWAFRQGDKIAMKIRCDVLAHVLEVFVPSASSLPSGATQQLAFGVEEKEQQDEARLLKEESSSSERMVARVSLRRCGRGGLVLDFDELEIAIAVGEEVVLPLTCVLAVLLMTPDFAHAHEVSQQ